MTLVARYLYGRDDAWPLATPRFMHDQLTRELWVLHIFVSSNINPTRQRTRFTEHRAILLHHLAWLRKIDLRAHIFEFIRELATAVDSQRTIHFSCLISGLCLTQGVSLFPTEEANPPAALLNARSVENSETKIAARGWQILHIQQTQDVVLGNLRIVTGQVGDLQAPDAMTRSNLRTFDYQYHQLHDQVSRIGSRMETLDKNVARISGTISSFSQQLASFPTSASTGPPHHPDPSTSHLPPEST
ncbi:Uncharacterized protein Adt_45547 [Abeliophyllum distichum]|uniref:Putative plant transposon protein domain-containing protein n=1 Tax=Abeliophyllum distichum TaxID=126358 RepID=A0ABD1PEP8_9LAMI